MKSLLSIYFILSSLLFANNVFAEDNFKRISLDNHKIYRYDFDLNESQLLLTRALDDGKLALENVLSCSQRHNADAAFNAGFFHEGYKKNGIPSWLFINKANIFAINSSQDGVYITNDNKIHFAKLKSKIYLTTHKNKQIPISSINNPTPTGIKVFTQNYWPSSLSNPGTFEIIVENNIVSEVNVLGNNKIPAQGFVISANKDRDIKTLSAIKPGAKIHYHLDISADGQKLDVTNISALISGSEFLLKNSQIPEKLLSPKSKSAFRDEPHGRTVLCQIDKTKYAVFVADHNPAKVAYDLPIKEIIMPLKQRGLDRETALAMPAGQLLEMFHKLQNNVDTSIGINLPKLAHWLKSEGCITAINLDGGGSSTLVVDNKVANNPTGLQNDNIDGKNLRAVGDIFLVKKI